MSKTRAAQRLALDFQLLEQALENVALARFGSHHVPQVADLGLADTVDAAEALLQAVRVPRQVVVDHQVGVLQVHAFAGRVGGHSTRAVGSLRNSSCTLRRSSRLTPPWIITTASSLPIRPRILTAR
jgi:hypothetical protein